jgi:hypothetical protein
MRTSSGKRKIRDYCFDQIQLAILCGSESLGFTVYKCPHCGAINIIPNRCHSRFCSSCAVKVAKQNAIRACGMALNCKHRHAVFTIPEELRVYFLRDRSLLNVLFLAARDTVYDLVNGSIQKRILRAKKGSKKSSKKNNKNGKKRTGKNKKKRRKPRKILECKSLYTYKDYTAVVIPGFFLTLHTFGRDLKWNPHIHGLIAEQAYNTKKDKMVKVYFPYKSIRKHWQFHLLDLLSKTDQLKNDWNFKRLKNYLYRKYPEGFYSHCPDKDPELKDGELNDKDFEKLNKNMQSVVKYITRYTNRPVIADSRIKEYDEVSKKVWWTYTSH